MFKILVLEDDKELNRTVCAFLNNSGYEAVGCINANEAYDALYENTIDLIVSDIMMPGVDGFEFAIDDVNNHQSCQCQSCCYRIPVGTQKFTNHVIAFCREQSHNVHRRMERQEQDKRDTGNRHHHFPTNR